MKMLSDNASRFKFTPLTASDFPLLYTWLNSNHVLAHWDGARSLEEVQTKYSDKINSDWQRAYMVSLDWKTFGYVQSYIASKAGPGWWPEEPETTVGIDQFIGDAAFLGRGLGADMAREFSEQLLAQPGIKKVIADPKPENIRAIRCYKSAGFKEVGVVSTPDGESLFMEKHSKSC